MIKFIKRVIAQTKLTYLSLMMKESVEEIEMPYIAKKYSIPAHQNGGDIVDEETIVEKKEEADMTGATPGER